VFKGLTSAHDGARC